MSFLKFGSHMERVMKHVGERQSVKITNYTDSGQEDNRGETIWDNNSFVVDEALVELEQATLNHDNQGTESLYDAVVYIPLDNEVYEATNNNLASEISFNSKDYVVQKKDEQNGMIVLGCRRKR